MNLLSAFCRKQMIWNLRRRSGSGLPPGIRRFSGGAKTDKVGQALCLPSRKGGTSPGGAGCTVSNDLTSRVDSADFFGGLGIVTIGTMDLDDPLPIATADGDCDTRFP